MKLGNVSQAVVPVPNFFLNTDEKNQTFLLGKLKQNKRKNRSKSYFRDDDLLISCVDLNLNRNPRGGILKFDLNQQRYIPIYNRGHYPSNSEEKNTYFPAIIDNSRIPKTHKNIDENSYENYREFMNKTNLHKFFNSDMREDIMHNTHTLLDRINANYDLDKWAGFDSRTTFNRFYQTAYSPLTDFIKRNGSIKDKFSSTLRDTAMSLKTVSEKAKQVLSKTMLSKDNEGFNKPNNRMEQIDEMLLACRTNLLRLKYNNKEPFEYNKEDQKFIDENKYITKTLNKTKLYKDFPSKTRMEFEEKKIIIPKKKFKIIDDSQLVSKNKYKFNERELFNCRDKMWARPLHKDAYELNN